MDEKQIALIKEACKESHEMRISAVLEFKLNHMLPPTSTADKIEREVRQNYINSRAYEWICKEGNLEKLLIVILEV